MLEICTFFATKSVNLWFVQVIVVENSTDEEDEETKALNPLPIVWNQRRDKNGFKIFYILVCKIKTLFYISHCLFCFAKNYKDFNIRKAISKSNEPNIENIKIFLMFPNSSLLSHQVVHDSKSPTLSYFSQQKWTWYMMGSKLSRRG